MSVTYTLNCDARDCTNTAAIDPKMPHKYPKSWHILLISMQPQEMTYTTKQNTWALCPECTEKFPAAKTLSENAGAKSVDSWKEQMMDSFIELIDEVVAELGFQKEE